MRSVCLIQGETRNTREWLFFVDLLIVMSFWKMLPGTGASWSCLSVEKLCISLHRSATGVCRMQGQIRSGGKTISRNRRLGEGCLHQPTLLWAESFRSSATWPLPHRRSTIAVDEVGWDTVCTWNRTWKPQIYCHKAWSDHFSKKSISQKTAAWWDAIPHAIAENLKKG